MSTVKQLYNTHINLSVQTRATIVEMLNAMLSDAFDLYTQTKFAHWNVKGANFIATHELFDKIADEVSDAIDDIAERITALGGVAGGSIQEIAQQTTLPHFPKGIEGTESYIRALAERVGVFANATRAGVDTSSEHGDQITADLLTSITRGLDKQLYFLEAHIN
jgi:starvation-inducible DNA-binding protein